MDTSTDQAALPSALQTSALVASAPHAPKSTSRTAQAPGYQRRRPEATALHRIVREHRATLFSDASARSASGRGYPQFVIEEFDKYERCGIFAYGVVRVYCDTCRQSDVVAFSCKGRALDPAPSVRSFAPLWAHRARGVAWPMSPRIWSTTCCRLRAIGNGP